MAAKDADLATDYAQRNIFVVRERAAFAVSLYEPGASSEEPAELFLVNGLPPEPPPPPPEPDITPPAITNILPPIGTGITATQVIQFDILDLGGLAAAALFASFPDGSVELVHDSNSFRGRYVGDANTRVAIANGFRFTVRRLGGWTQSPTFEFLSVDTSGNIGVLT